jgi:hypothetical protein
MPGLITKLGITPNALSIFLTYDVYLTQGGGVLHRRLSQF